MILSPAEDLVFDTRAAAICSNDMMDSGGVGTVPLLGDGLLRIALFNGTLVEEDEDDATGGPEGETLSPESLLRLLPMTFKLKVLPNSASLAFCI